MISLCCPTRGRPDNIRRFVASALGQAFMCHNVECLFYVDEDDPSPKPDIPKELMAYCRFIVGPRITLSECTNQCAKEAKGEILGYMGDDIIFRTEDWETYVEDAFEESKDKILLVYGRDGYQDEKLATHGFVSRRWYETLGYLVPPYFVSEYSDTWLTQIAQSLGRLHYIPELYTEHMHPIAGKAAWDKTHEERKARGDAAKVGELFDRLLPKRLEDFHKLKRLLA